MYIQVSSDRLYNADFFREIRIIKTGDRFEVCGERRKDPEFIGLGTYPEYNAAADAFRLLRNALRRGDTVFEMPDAPLPF